MRTEDLITELASRAAPVRPLPSPAVRLGRWSAIGLGCAGAGVLVFGARAGVGSYLTVPEFLQTALIAAGTALLAAAAALVLAVPGAERSSAMRSTTIGLIVLWAVVLIAAVVRAANGLTGVADWPVCFVRVIAIGAVPAMALFRMLRAAAPLRLAWTSGLAAVAALAVGALAIQFICPLTDPGHALFGHLGPVVVIGWLAVAFSKRLLADWRR